MNRKYWFLVVIGLLFAAQAARAGDVVYTIWEDDGGRFLVRIENDTERRIQVETILIVFYNERGKPVDQQNIPCKGDCGLGPHDTKDFGPYAPPAGADSARVRNVRYSVE